jgi:hypothetical protein
LTSCSGPSGLSEGGIDLAARKKKKKRKSTQFGQKFAVAVSLVVLVLCAASATFSFIVRHRMEDGHSRPFPVEVPNGTGESGLAHDAKRGLLRRGIDVIAVGNADHFDYPESILIARKPGADVGMLGAILGCKNVIVQIREDSIEDASLILGADYRELDLELDGE